MFWNKNNNFLLIGFVLMIFLIYSCGTGSRFIYQQSEKDEIARAAELNAWSMGKEMWFDADLGTNGRSCESCHPNGDITNAEMYPRYKHVLRTMATISMTHNFAVVNESKGEPWILGSEPSNALVLFVKSLADGETIRLAPPELYKKEWVDKGRTAFIDTAPGTNGKSCNSCHAMDKKSLSGTNNHVPLKGVAAYYPKYSAKAGRVILLEQQINACIESSMNGRPLPLDHETIVALTTYLTYLSEGFEIKVTHGFK